MPALKKIISIFSASLLVAISLTVGSTGAQALESNDRVVGAVGSAISEYLPSFECTPPAGVTPTYYTNGTLPPGISLDPQTGRLTGTFSEAGTFNFTDSPGCQWSIGDQTWSQGQPVSVEFIVYAEAATSTPAPSLTVESLGNTWCSVQITGSVPAEQDPRSLTLTMWSASNPDPMVIALKDQPVDTPFTLTYNPGGPDNFSEEDLAKMRSISWEYYDCNELMSVQLSYKSHLSPVASSPVVTAVTSLGNLEATPVVISSYVPDPLCGIYLEGWLPTTGDLGTRATVLIEGETSGNIMTIHPLLYEAGYFDIYIPLGDMSQYLSSESGEIVAGSTNPVCGEDFMVSAVIVLNGQEIVGTTGGETSLFCDAGTYKNDTACSLAPAGTYSPEAGMSQPIGCEKGTFQNNTGATSCFDAPKGFYVATKRAISATPCPAGKTTLNEGSTSVQECYTLKTQAFTTFKAPKGLKYGQSVTLPTVTDSNLRTTIEISGRCEFVRTTMKVKVGKRTRTVDAVKIRAGNQSGTCNITLTNEGDAVYKPFTKSTTIKVSRTGK